MEDLKLKPIVSVEEIRSDLKVVSNNGDDWFSSILASDDDLNKWQNKNQLFFTKTENTYFLFRQRYGCKRCYIASSNIAVLENDIRKMLAAIDDVIITSVLDKNEQNKSVKDAILAAGFHKYAVNHHIAIVKDTKKSGICKLPFAETSDFVAIKEIIQENFSPYLDHNPDDDEIIEAIEDKRILVMRDKENQKVVGMQSIKKLGKVLDGRYLATAKSYRARMPVGPLLWREAMKLYPDVVKFTGWIKEGNTTAEQMNYEVFKFKKDGLTDTYFINNANIEDDGRT